MRVELASGAAGRLTNAPARGGVVLVNGGRKTELAGTWSATLEWLVRRLAPRFPELGFLEVRYRVKSWRRLDLCAADADAALGALADRGAPRSALVGFSMGGAVCVLAADSRVPVVVGLAPWLPERLTFERLVGKRFAVIQGALDRGVPGIPGVTPQSSRRGFARAREAGVTDSEYTLIAGGLHGTAVRSRLGLVALPRAARWADLVARELSRFQAAADGARAGRPVGS